ncbi:MAG: transposase [Acidobacteriota bacterium]
MKHYAGVDLHCNNNLTLIIDEKDRICFQARLGNHLEEVLGALEPFRERLRGVAVESTYNWYWLVDGLQEADYAVHLVNTTAVKQYEGLKYRGDQSDAFHTAHLLRLGILPTGFIYPRRWRGVRDLLRKRGHLVRQRTANVLSLQNSYARSLAWRLSSREVQGLEGERLMEHFEDANVGLAAWCALQAIEHLNKLIEVVEQRVASQMEKRPQWPWLQSVSGIGEILGLTIVLETGEISRFPTVGSYASYARCVESGHYSNGKKKGKGNRKNGNKYLGWAYHEASHYAVRFHRPSQRYYDKKKARTKDRVAWSALANKLCRASYFVMRDQVNKGSLQRVCSG